jgi:DNA-binding HxlR family transcriptional regulator
MRGLLKTRLLGATDPTPNVLTNRLNRLVDEGIFERVLTTSARRGTSTR